MSRPILTSQDALGRASQPQPRKSPPVSSPSGSQPPEKPSYAKRGKITIVACVPCRRRKTKCDGKRPSCSQCEARDGQCSYDMTDDQRKLTYLRDNVEQLQDKANSLESLLATIQGASEGEAVELFRRLRSGGDVQVVAELVQAGHLLSGVSRKSQSQDPSITSPQTQLPSLGGDTLRLQQHDQLVDAIVDSGPSSSLDIMRRIRRRESVGSILHDALTGRLETQPLLTNSSGQPRSSIETTFESQDQTFGMMKGDVVDATHAAPRVRSEFPVSIVPRRSWTTVTQNYDLIEHLVTLYFTWQHSFFQSFPEKLFRSDMAQGRTKYCSSMLVNAICAAGCFFSTRKEVTEDRGDGYNLKVSFYEEAVSLLGQNPRPSVPTTAALYLLSYVEGTRGDLSSLWTFSGRSSLMALDLNLHLRRNRRTSDDGMESDELDHEEKARSYAFWGSFHVDQTTCFTLGRLPVLNRNGVTLDLPSVDNQEDEDPWEAYETNLPHRPGARSSTFKYCATLSNVVNSTLMMFFAPVVPLSGSLLLDEYEKYLHWYQSLPDKLSATDNAPPHVLCLHMYYHSAILLLFRPFLKATLDDSDVVPREVCRSSANAISDLWARHHGMYELAGIYMFQVHCLLTACTIHIINIPTISSTKYFTQACEHFQELIPRNEWARSSLHILRNLVEKWNLILPIEAEEALYRDSSKHPKQISKDVTMHQPTPQPTPGMMDWRRPTDRGASTFDSSVPNMRPVSPNRAAVAESPVSPTKPSKRTSSDAGRNLPRDSSASSSQGAEASQKRQRLRSPMPRLGKIGSAGPEATIVSPQSRSVSNYLYSPLADQPAPLLVPVHPPSGSSSATVNNQAVSGKESAAPESGESSDRAGKTQTSSSSGTSSKPRRSERGKRTGAEVHGIEHGVEGLSFGDDWRDPFMGYLGEA